MEGGCLKHSGTSTIDRHGQLPDGDCSCLTNPDDQTIIPHMEGYDSGTHHADKVMEKEVG